MQQWEYLSLCESTLNYYGKEGWELVGIYREEGSVIGVFKRPL